MTALAAPATTDLAAGPLTALLDGIDVRYAYIGDREVIRRLYAAVRDAGWGTVASDVADLRVATDGDGFEIALHVVHRAEEIWFEWDGSIRGEGDGRLEYALDGVCRSAFSYNRIGLCLLHPTTFAGAAYEAESTAGRFEGRLPETIGPQRTYGDAILGLFPPFTRLRLGTGKAAVEFAFEGDLFEMEDQRNWTDASFKTYSTPMTIPIPHHAEAGARIRQRVTLVPPARRIGRRRRVDEVTIALEWGLARPLPPIGIGIHPGTSGVAEEVAATRPAHLRIDWTPDADVNVPPEPGGLELALTTSIEELATLGRMELPPSATRVLLYERDAPVTSNRLVELLLELLGDDRPPVAAGTRDSFVELNRGNELPLLADALCYSINPQAHAFDDRSLVESLAAQADTVESARALAAGNDPVVSRVTLLPYGAETADPRQRAPFAAAWALGSIKQLAEAGAASITIFEADGVHGLDGSPAAATLARLTALRGRELVAASSSDQLAVQALAVRDDGTFTVVLANLTPEPRRCRIVDGDAAVVLEPWEVTQIEQPV